MEHQPDSVLAMRDWIRGELLSKSEQLPSLPHVVQRVLELVNDPEADAAKMAVVLRHDPALVGKILAIANSPLMGISRRITSVREAVMVVGFQRLASMTLTAGVTNFLDGDYTCYGYEEGGLWKHSMCVATCSQELGRFLGLDFETVEELFIAGLMHDVGKILLGPYLSQVAADAVGHPDEAAEVERDLLGIDHFEAASFLADKWNLGPLVTAVVCHQDQAVVADDTWTAVAAVKLAAAFVGEHRIGYLPGHRNAASFSEDDLGDENHGRVEWEEVRTVMTAALKKALETVRTLGKDSSRKRPAS
jgi:HD-like signal output (HDOD) protein